MNCFDVEDADVGSLEMMGHLLLSQWPSFVG